MYVGTCVYFHIISPSYYCLNMRLSNITDTTEIVVGEGFPRRRFSYSNVVKAKEAPERQSRGEIEYLISVIGTVMLCIRIESYD